MLCVLRITGAQVSMAGEVCAQEPVRPSSDIHGAPALPITPRQMCPGRQAALVTMVSLVHLRISLHRLVPSGTRRSGSPSTRRRTSPTPRCWRSQTSHPTHTTGEKRGWEATTAGCVPSVRDQMAYGNQDSQVESWGDGAAGKCLIYNHEDLSLGSQEPIQPASGPWHMAGTPALGLASQSVKVVRSRFSERPGLKK